MIYSCSSSPTPFSIEELRLFLKYYTPNFIQLLYSHLKLKLFTMILKFLNKVTCFPSLLNLGLLLTKPQTSVLPFQKHFCLALSEISTPVFFKSSPQSISGFYKRKNCPPLLIECKLEDKNTVLLLINPPFHLQAYNCLHAIM